MNKKFDYIEAYTIIKEIKEPKKYVIVLTDADENWVELVIEILAKELNLPTNVVDFGTTLQKEIQINDFDKTDFIQKNFYSSVYYIKEV